MPNCVTPTQERMINAKGEFQGYYKPPRYMVDVPALPGLVARAVMPFKYLTMREDFATRFKDCKGPDDVRKVLSKEGFYE